ncbi:hypothetical protein DRW03_27875 [Corallococcus sp. H22C18031201]|uniref:hypothetical protein n=1 Tax=Citreicoccus inhibens TaxID=2849499 RepID=UPI000E770FF6|nr:hypothetical protein [Citreicoccus inhibens]MBU8896305.1 hypothetical protein [Citreicoccus inhibens]RJS17365.1 hypothetical protein DRW03_27875 [Corallococcus sp. H22C18031201]
MDVVLRPINDRFLQELVLPFLTRAMGDAAGALESLGVHLGDAQARVLCERLVATSVPGGVNSVDTDAWMDLVDRLVFMPWREDPAGWDVGGMHEGYADDWDEALHVALMVEDPAYPYWEAREARAVRDAFRLRPRGDMGLASLLAGQWEPFPEFPPDRVFATQGRGEYQPRERFAFADWAWRPARAVAHWQVNLPRKLERLMSREQERMRLSSLPERDEVLGYWLGKVSQPPPLTVAFSGLGPRAASWIRELGALTAHVRSAAQTRQGLASLVTRGTTVRL